MESKPSIILSLIKKNNVIQNMIIKKQVKKVGSGGYVILPKQLIGKYVKIYYNEGEHYAD